MKKVFALLLAFCLVCSFTTPAFAQDSFDYDEAYTWAIEAGYPEEFLTFVSEDPSVLREIYYEFKDADELEVSASHEVMNIDANPQARGNISSSLLDFWMVASKFSTNGYITYVRVHVAYEWIGSTSPWGTDGVVVNWDADLWNYIQSTSEFTAEMRTGGITGPAYETLSAPATGAQGGIGWYCDLWATDGIYGCASFKLFPRDSLMQNGTRYTTTITATYAHETVEADSLTIGITDVSATFSGSRDERATTAAVTYGV